MRSLYLGRCPSRPLAYDVREKQVCVVSRRLPLQKLQSDVRRLALLSAAINPCLNQAKMGRWAGLRTGARRSVGARQGLTLSLAYQQGLKIIPSSHEHHELPTKNVLLPEGKGHGAGETKVSKGQAGTA